MNDWGTVVAMLVMVNDDDQYVLLNQRRPTTTQHTALHARIHTTSHHNSLNHQELHKLPKALGGPGPNLAKKVLEQRYEEDAVCRWPMAREALSEALAPLQVRP